MKRFCLTQYVDLWVSNSKDDLEQLLPTKWIEHCVVELVLLLWAKPVVCLFQSRKHVLIGSVPLAKTIWLRDDSAGYGVAKD